MLDPGRRVLIADDEEGLRFVLRELLTREGCEVHEAEDGAEAVDRAREQGFDLYLLDMKMPRLDGLSALKQIRHIYPEALAVMITAFSTQQLAVDALKAGAYDYFSKPFNLEELRIILLRALDKQLLLRRVHQLERQLGEQSRLGRMIGRGEPMRQVFKLIERVAGHDITVLITGESGTGKELVAHAIHTLSPRRAGPFIKVNCAAIPEPLLESELFGHEKGAFTGAAAAHAGKFEAANGGTILLDEIGEMPLALQAKLLRVLQEHEIERVGSNSPRPIDIRVLAATNRDLAAMVAARTFREDLYFRINVVPVPLPPLRERREDLPELVHAFIEESNTRFGKRLRGIDPEAMAALERHDWPGNIRELENTIQRAMVMAQGDAIDVAALPAALQRLAGEAAREPNYAGIGCGPRGLNGNGAAHSAIANGVRDGGDDGGNASGAREGEADDESFFALPLANRIERVIEQEERRAIKAALRRMQGHRQETADLLGISRKSLHNKMIKYGLFE